MCQRKHKIVQYKFLPLLLLIALFICLGFYFLRLSSMKMDDEGIALDLQIEFSKKIDDTIFFYLKPKDGEPQSLIKIINGKNQKYKEILFFKGNADLIAKVNNEDLVLVKNIDSKKKQELDIVSTVSESNKKVSIQSKYIYRKAIDFSKFNEKKEVKYKTGE